MDRPTLGYLNIECALGTIVGPSKRDGMYYVATGTEGGRTSFDIARSDDFRAVLNRGAPNSVAEIFIRRSRGIN